MSRIVEQAKNVYDKLTGGGKTSVQTAGNTTYTGSNIQGQTIGGPGYGTTYPSGPGVAYGGSTVYSQAPGNPTLHTTGGYSRLGETLTHQVVAE